MAAPIIIQVKLGDKEIPANARAIKSALDAELKDVGGLGEAAGKKIGSALSSNVGISLKKIGQEARQAGTALTAAITLPVLGLGAAVIKTGFDFEKSMNDLTAATKPTNEQLRQATALAKQLGNDLSLPAISANDAAAAMTTLAKAGLSLDESMAAVKGSLQLAAAAGIDAAKAAEIQSDAINTFKLSAADAGRIADLLAASANATSGEITDVADALKQAGAAASTLNIPIEDTVTALGLLASAGIRGSDAGTSLKTTLTQLAKPSKEGAAALAEIGFKAFDAQGKLKPLRQLTEEYTAATIKLTDQKRLEIATAIAGTDGQRALIKVLGAGVEAYDKIKSATTVAGEAQRIAAEKAKGAVGAYEALKSQLETFGLQIFDLVKGPFLAFLQTLNQVVTALAALPEPVQQSLVVLALLAATLGPLLVLFGTLISSVGTIAGLFGVELVVSVGTVTGLFTGLGATLGALVAATGPFGLAIIAAGLLAAGLYYLATAQQELIPVTNEQIATTRKQVDAIDALLPKLAAVGESTFVTKEEQQQLKAAYDLLNPAAQARIDALKEETQLSSKLTQELQALKAQTIKESVIDGAVTVAEFVKIQEQLEQTKADIELFRTSKEAAFNRGDLSGVQFFKAEIAKTEAALKTQNVALEETIKKLTAIGQVTGQNARDFAITAQTKGLIKDYQAVATAIEDFQGKLKAQEDAAKKSASAVGTGAKTELDKLARSGAFAKAGNDAGAGYAQGILQKLPEVKAASAALGKASEAGLRDQIKSKSPSLVFKSIGLDITAGLVLGLQEGGSQVTAALNTQVDAAIANAHLKASDIKKITAELAKSGRETAQEIQQFGNPKILAAKNRNADLEETLQLSQDIFKLQREITKLENVPQIPQANKLPVTREGLENLKATLEAMKGLDEAVRKTLAPNKEFVISLKDIAEAAFTVPPSIAAINAELNASDKATKKALESYDSIKTGLQGVIDATEGLTQAQKLRRQIDQLPGDFDPNKRNELEELFRKASGAESEKETREQLERTRKVITDTFSQAFRDGFEKGPKAFFARIFTAGKETFQRLAANALATLTTQILGGFLNRLGGLFGRGGNGGQGAGGGGIGGLLGGLLGGGGAASGGTLGGGSFASGGSGGIGGFIKNLLGGGGGSSISAPASLSGGQLPLNLGLGSQRTLGLTNIASGIGGGGIGGLLGGLFKGVGFGKQASSGGALAGALPLLGLSLGSSLGGQSGLGKILGAAGGGLLGIGLSAAPAVFGAGGAFASPALAALFSNPITAVVGGALLVGALLLGKAKQRKADESLVDTYWVEYMNKTKTLTDQVNGDQIDGAKALSEALNARSEAIGLISQIKTKSVRDSRLQHQIPDVDRLFLEPLKAAIEAQKKRGVNVKNIIPEFATGGIVPGVDFGMDSVLALLRPNEVILNQAQQARIQAMAGSDIFGRAGVPGFGAPNSMLTSNGLPAYALGGIAAARPVTPSQGNVVVIETLSVEMVAGTDAQTQFFVNGAESADGQKVVIKTVKAGRKFREF